MKVNTQEHLLALIKGVTWRIFGTLATTVIVLVLTGKTEIALGVGAFEIVSKIILFYFHERLWEFVRRKGWLGRTSQSAPNTSTAASS